MFPEDEVWAKAYNHGVMRRMLGFLGPFRRGLAVALGLTAPDSLIDEADTLVQ